MSVIFNSSLEGLVRTTNIIPKTSNMTVGFFFRYIAIPAGPPTNNSLFYWGDDPSTTFNDYVWLYIDSADELNLDVGIDGTPTNATFAFDDLGLYYIVYVRNGTSHQVWVNGIKRIDITVDVNVAAFTAPTHTYLGSDTIADDWDSAEYAYYREWNTALIKTEILAEMNSPDFAVVKTASLQVDTPLVADILDDSGNGYDWSLAGGAVTFTTGVLNQDEYNARPVFGLPVVYSQNAVSGAVTYDLWYRYIPLATELEMGVFGFGDLVTYLPELQVLTGTLGSLTTYKNITGQQNLPVQIPIPAATPNFYYFKFATNAGNPTPAVLKLDLQCAPVATIPAGSIFVNDDTNGFPGAFVDSSSGAVINFAVPFPNGEGGDVLTNGYMLFEDFGNNNIKTYDSNFNADKTIAFGNGFVRVRANQTANKFYLGNADNPSTVKAVDSTGVVTATYTLTGNANLNAIASNNADTVLYYSTLLAGSALKRWDLVGDVALSDLLTGVAGQSITDILNLPDDTILVSYTQLSTTFIVLHYNSSGTLLHTYNLGTETFPSGTFPRISYSHDASLTFWAWSHNTDGTSRWRRVTIADGSLAVDISSCEYEGGIYQSAAAATPTCRFGISFSCPFIVLPPGPGGGVTSSNTDGTIFVGSSSLTGGLYQLVPGKTNDTNWLTFTPETTEDLKIPDPTVRTGDIGG